MLTLQYLDDALFLARRSLELQAPDRNAWQQHFTLGEILKAYGHHQEAVLHFKVTLINNLNGSSIIFKLELWMMLIDKLNDYLAHSGTETRPRCSSASVARAWKSVGRNWIAHLYTSHHSFPGTWCVTHDVKQFGGGRSTGFIKATSSTLQSSTGNAFSQVRYLSSSPSCQETTMNLRTNQEDKFYLWLFIVLLFTT